MQQRLRYVQKASNHPGLVTSTEHYENFPVASILVPARLRPAIGAVYRFARYGDDVADEGSAPQSERLAELTRMRSAILGQTNHPFVDPVHQTIKRHSIPTEHFVDLLSAFSQDAAGTHYADRAELLDYCRRSANPVGRIVLRIFDADESGGLAASDAICSALQLINFIQDAGQDISRGRNYFPANEMHSHQVSLADLNDCVEQGAASAPVRALLATQCRHARELMNQGPALLKFVPFRLRLELSAVIAGGATMLERVSNQDPFSSRIKLGRKDMPNVIISASRIFLRRQLR